MIDITHIDDDQSDNQYRELIDDDQSARSRSSGIQKVTTSHRAEVGGAIRDVTGLKGLRPGTTQKPGLLSHYLRKTG